MIRISVIIPVYNAEEHLRECLNSVLDQTIKDIEVICIDDGSTDYSYDIMLEYTRRYSNVIALQQKNQGSGVARNKGIEQATGKYLCFMDSDDYYVQDFSLERLLTEAEEKNAAVCGGNMISVSGNEKKRWMDWFRKKEKIVFREYGNLYCYQRYIFRSDIIKKNHILFPEYRRYQDPPFLLAVMAHAQEFYAVNEVVYALRRGHKEVNYTLKVTIDLLRAIRDCFKISQEYNLDKVYELYLKFATFSYLPAIYKHADQNQIWEVIGEINKICTDWMGEPLEGFTDRTSMEEYVTSLRSKKKNLLDKCHAAQEVVIYGAGIAGKFFLEYYGKECSCIAGFAVSKKDLGEAFDEGYEVKEITEYSRKALIVVAVSQKYAGEILQNLEKLQFKNVCYVEYAGLKLLEEL